METPAETDKANVSHYRTVSLTKCGKTLISKESSIRVVPNQDSLKDLSSV